MLKPVILVVAVFIGPVCRAQDLSITKQGGEDCGGGGGGTPVIERPCGSFLFMYVLEITNIGPSAATNVTVTDTLPESVIFGRMFNPAPFSCNAPADGGTGTITCTMVAMQPGETRSLGYFVKIPPAYPNQVPLVNTATVSAATADPNPSDNTVTSTLEVHVRPFPVPTLSEVAFLILALTLSIAGAGALRRL